VGLISPKSTSAKFIYIIKFYTLHRDQKQVRNLGHWTVLNAGWRSH